MSDEQIERTCLNCNGTGKTRVLNQHGHDTGRDRPCGTCDGAGQIVPASALRGTVADLVCREQEIKALLEPLRKLVEGRYSPDCRDRSDDFWQNAGQWTVWLTRDEHENYRDLLEALSADVEMAA